ncbi:hypothetical protein OsccyDRAFT_4708 [Leptolyngbyaceae cyanobacterium JSC-12]|nr:hypothetical protein OsccyDRAFT_4708 [Leptolyngbyaceae cyanobacterium JSC-12]
MHEVRGDQEDATMNYMELECEKEITIISLNYMFLERSAN